jgi:hypothetical protein
MPALSELPMIKVVQPAYHCLPKGGHGSFFPSGNLRFNCDRVFATRLWSGSVFGRKDSGLRTFGGVCYCYTIESVHDSKTRSDALLHISTAPAVAPARIERIALGY